jgi:hypothetical protein
MDLLPPIRTRIIAQGCAIAFMLYFLRAVYILAPSPVRLTTALDDPRPTPIPPLLASERNPADTVTEYGDYAFLPSSLSSLFPAPDAGRKDYREWNALSIRELHVCLALDNCGANQRKVALLASHWFEESIVRGYTGGEGIWCVDFCLIRRALKRREEPTSIRIVHI